MSTFGNQDRVLDVPKFSKERTVRPDISLVANNVSIAPTKILYFSDTTGVRVGDYVSGNNISISSVLPGFFNANVQVTQVNSSNVVVSANIIANVQIGDLFNFDNTISYRTGEGYFPDTYLVSESRLANVAYGNNINHPIAHTGWNRIKEGTGPIDSISILDGGNNYSNGYVIFSGSAKYTTLANAQYTVNANGTIDNISIKHPGIGYNTAPTSISFTGEGIRGGNANAILSISMGGRAGRITSETLVALSEVNISNTDSGGIFFTSSL